MFFKFLLVVFFIVITINPTFFRCVAKESQSIDGVASFDKCVYLSLATSIATLDCGR